MSDAELSGKQLTTLAAVLDTLVPPDATCGRQGAGELGLAAPIFTALAAAPGMGALVAATLDELDTHAGPALGFAALEHDDRERVLRELTDVARGVVSGLVFQTYLHYYEHPRVIESLGLEARPPFPLGHSLETGDLGLLDPVRRREKLYRDA